MLGWLNGDKAKDGPSVRRVMKPVDVCVTLHSGRVEGLKVSSAQISVAEYNGGDEGASIEIKLKGRRADVLALAALIEADMSREEERSDAPENA